MKLSTYRFFFVSTEIATNIFVGFVLREMTIICRKKIATTVKTVGFKTIKN